MDKNLKLKSQLLEYYAEAMAAGEMYRKKADKVDNFGFQGTKNFSPEGVGSFVAFGGILAKLAYCGARLVESVANVPQSFSNGLDAASLPLNAVAGFAIALGAGITAASIIKDKIFHNINNTGADLSDQAHYAREAFYALQDGKMNLPEGATIEDAMLEIRNKEVADYLAQGGEENDVEYFYPTVDTETSKRLISKMTNAKGFDDEKTKALALIEENTNDFVAE